MRSPCSPGVSRKAAVPFPAVGELQGLLDFTTFLFRQFRGGFGRQPVRRPFRPGDERVHLGELFLYGIALGHLARRGMHQVGRDVHARRLRVLPDAFGLVSLQADIDPRLRHGGIVSTRMTTMRVRSDVGDPAPGASLHGFPVRTTLADR